MRHMGMTVFMSGAVLSSAGLPAGHAQSSALATDVKTTAEIILGGERKDEIPKATSHLIDLLSRIATDGKLPEGIREKVDGARTSSPAGAMLDAKSVAALREAYALINAGRPFAMPDDVDSFDALMSHGRGRVERSVAALAKGRSEEAARELLGFILFVMTPVDMPGGAPPPAD